MTITVNAMSSCSAEQPDNVQSVTLSGFLCHVDGAMA